MNLQLANTDISEWVTRQCQNRTRGYTDFIDSAVELLRKDSTSIPVDRKEVDVKFIANGLEQTRKEIRFYPVEPQTHEEERAIEILFDEYTRKVYFSNKNFGPPAAVDILRRNLEEEYVVLNRDFQGNRLFIQPETYQLIRQKQAIERLRFSPLLGHEPLVRLFSDSNDTFWRKANEFNYVKDWYILTKENLEGITEQRNFVEKALQTPDFALMEGPPGSGKTTAIIELIIQYAILGKRVLLCSATHAAIDNVFERIKERDAHICDRYIVPVRISGDEGPVKDNVKPLLLKNLVNTYKEKFKTHLVSNNQKGSQKFLRNTIGSSDKIIDNIILESANLVGGTTMGILQHPDIANNAQSIPFDVLIIDEASKVTFQDFIVPALYAKKWILVGDVKQLSPYIEDDYVAEYIDKLLDDKDRKQMLINHFELRLKMSGTKYNNSIKVFFTNGNVEHDRNFVLDHSGGQEVVAVDDDSVVGEELLYRLNGADVIVCKNTEPCTRLLLSHLCSKAIFINSELTDLKSVYQQRYFHKAKERFCFTSKEESWPDMVTRSLNESFSFRQAGNDFSNVDRRLELLLPADIELKRPTKNGTIRLTTLRNEIDELKRLVYPSILELLQNGNGKLVTYNKEGVRQEDQNSVIATGLNKNAKHNKFTALTYQHRMHEMIARTSKENFYSETDSLKPSSLVIADRGWRYKKEEDPVIWVTNTEKTGNSKALQLNDTNRDAVKNSPYLRKKFGNKLKGTGQAPVGIINVTEANQIEKELLAFIEWARLNPPKSDGKWGRKPYELAVLTFYLHQQSILKERIRNLTGQHSHHSRFAIDNVVILLYTVDKFQGQEADMVLLGFTKFTGSAHFNSPNRLNVALTRARHKLILFGNRNWFEQNARLNALHDLATNFKSRLSL
ncbi:MAG TPA: AAA domain-containing protein [Chitinophagales bacterium]|nr:AAA domain-containing protein [Chitinophagales bacterium]